jgi:hypothetical protein
MRSLLFLVAIGSTLIAHSFAQGGSCTDVSTAECSDQEGCELCKMDVSWAKVEFCVSEEIADKLPERKKKTGHPRAQPTPCSNLFISYFFSVPPPL